MIETKNITKIYGSGEVEITALNQVSITIKQGEIVAVTGKSGSGKSTLLHMLGGIDFPTSGTVIFDGKDIGKFNSREREQYRNTKVGYVFQDFKLIPELYVKENIMLPAMICDGKLDMEYYQELIQSLELEETESKYPEHLSGGQQQRVAIARALINRPLLILCDEPTGNLDQKTGENVIKLLTEIREKYNTTIVIVTHDEKIANQCDCIIRISDGSVV